MLFATKISLTTSNGSLLASPIPYREHVGFLQYLTLTRPGISFVVNTVAQFMSSPCTAHMIVAKRILRDVKGTMNFGVTLIPQLAFATLSTYSDVN